VNQESIRGTTARSRAVKGTADRTRSSRSGLSREILIGGNPRAGTAIRKIARAHPSASSTAQGGSGVIEVIRRFANRVSSVPVVYEWIQRFAGQDVVYRRILETWTPPRDVPVLDVGSSGGGLTERISPRGICVDIDLEALVRARRKRPGLRLVVADAGRLPFRADSFEHTMCVAVSHHLDVALFPRAVGEFARVTRTSLLFLDATRTDRLLSRFLWSLDRGAQPRSATELRNAIEGAFEIDREKSFAVLHRYLLLTARPRGK
jgi:hypothetical protein